MTTSVEEHGAHKIHLPQPSAWPLVLGLGFVLLPFGFITWTQGDARRLPTVETVGLGMMLVGVVLLVAAVFGWMLSNIRERQKSHEEPLGGVEAAKLAMWAYLGSECLIFGGLIANMVYLWIRDHKVNEALHHLESLVIVSTNTFILLASSLFVVLALSAIQKGNRQGLAMWLAFTAVAGAAFVGIQGYEYNKLFSEGIVLSANRFADGFFLLTGFHGLHVLVGVLWAAVLVINTLRGGFTQHEHMGVEVFGLYWHFVDVVWILIFTLVYLI
jgi:cytochrome c oxidase subunit 3/cytochrome o ubiquinol oxidase subunit 3